MGLWACDFTALAGLWACYFTALAGLRACYFTALGRKARVCVCVCMSFGRYQIVTFAFKDHWQHNLHGLAKSLSQFINVVSKEKRNLRIFDDKCISLKSFTPISVHPNLRRL